MQFESPNLDKCLNLIFSNYEAFLSDENVVYKSCGGEWIVVMKKLSDTITNEMRENVVYSNHADFRANKLLVLKIFNKFNCAKTREEIISDYDSQFTYKVGEIVHSGNFDPYLEKTCAAGIHYYKTIDTAFHYHINTYYSYTGTHRTWYQDGEKCSVQIMESNGDGISTSWYKNGNIWIEGCFKNRKRNGIWRWWYANSKRYVEENYVDDKLHGERKTWHENGTPRSQSYYFNGKLL